MSTEASPSHSVFHRMIRGLRPIARLRSLRRPRRAAGHPTAQATTGALRAGPGAGLRTQRDNWTHHQLASTTHAVELDQLAELNELLPDPGGRLLVPAADLGLTGAAELNRPAGSALPPAAMLRRLSCEGPPEYPYIYGWFSISSPQDQVKVEVHTEALRRLSRRADRRHRWGAGG